MCAVRPIQLSMFLTRKSRGVRVTERVEAFHLLVFDMEVDVESV